MVDRLAARPLIISHGSIAFDQVRFHYGKDSGVLDDLSLTIAPGEKVGLVGPSGAGKSTVVNLLLRFYDIHKGSILLDGVDVKHMMLTDLRNRIGLVLQDVFLFSGSVEQNITLDNQEISIDQVKAAATAIGAAGFINRLPTKYEYEVRERGMSLSYGQRQLLSFARALVYDPGILVLDEATSSVDTETEEIIQTGLKTLMKGRTTVAIAHRLSTVQHANQILVMHHGTVRERGNHQQLLAQDGLYRRLYELQYRDQEKALLA